MMIFERITDKSFSLNGLTDELIFLYSSILASNKDCNLSYNDLIDACDKNPTILKNFSDFLISEAEKRNVLTPEEHNNEGKKKE